MVLQCKTEYDELCETIDKQKCHTEHEQVVGSRGGLYLFCSCPAMPR